MKAEPLEFPRGVRFPRKDETPARFDKEFARIAKARITTGFVEKKSEQSGYSTVIQANIHASRVWKVFRDLVNAIIPEAAAPIVGIKDEEPIFGPYTTREAALDVLEPYREPLQHDGFLEFGIIFQLRGNTEEVFVTNVKLIRIWTNLSDKIVAVLTRHGIPEVQDLQFIHEYPRVSEALPFEGQTSGWFPVLEALKSRFQALPDPPPRPDA